MIRMREATSNDAQALQALQRRCPQGASLVVDTVNIPDFFARAASYHQWWVWVAENDQQIVGSVAAAIKDTFINGNSTKVGYIFQLFVDPNQRRQGIAGQLIQQTHVTLQTHGAALAYCVIIDGNIPSIQTFTRQGWQFHKQMTMYGLMTYKTMHSSSPARIRAAQAPDLPAIAELINQTWHGHDLFKPYSADSLAAQIERMHGYSLDTMVVAERAGIITACAGWWDWGAITQITVKRFNTQLGLLNRILKLARLVYKQLPRLPQPGEQLRQWVLTPIGFSNPEDWTALVRQINNQATQHGVHLMFAAIDAPHPATKAFKGFLQANTTINIYTIEWQPQTWSGKQLYLPGEDA